MDLRIDHSVVEHRMESSSRDWRKSKKRKRKFPWKRIQRINTIERVARAQFERLHDMTVLKNKFVRDHENEMEALKASVETKKARDCRENSKRRRRKSKPSLEELAEAKDSYARELNVVSDLSSSRAMKLKS